MHQLARLRIMSLIKRDKILRIFIVSVQTEENCWWRKIPQGGRELPPVNKYS